MDKLRQLRQQLKDIEASRSQKLYELNRRKLERDYNPKNYDADKKLINEAHSKLKDIVRKELQTYQETYRKALAEQLNAPSDNTPEAESRWRKAIERVEQAKTPEQIQELCRYANKWKDSDIARALVYAHAGTSEKEYIHRAVLERDEIITELYNLEREFGAYRSPDEIHAQNEDMVDGWTTPENIAGADGVPGRVNSIRTPRNDWRLRKKLDEESKQ